MRWWTAATAELAMPLRIVPTLLAVALLATATAARAAVSIDPGQIVVKGAGASAVVTRAPFHLTIGDGAGRGALSEVPNSGQAPNAIAPAPNPAPLGSQAAGSAPTLYAPLAFTVGVDRSVQYPGAQWEGDQLAGTQAGTQYSARDVVAASADGAGGVQLTVSTDDPTGRRLVVRIDPGAAGSIHVSATPTPDAGVATMSDSFSSSPDEAFHGFGGRHNALDEHGQDFYNWIEQEDFGAGSLEPATASTPGSGGKTYLFPNGPTAAYYVQTLFVSSHPYGFMLDETALSRFRLDSDSPDAWQAAVAAPAIDYTVAPGRAAAAIATLTRRSGRHRVPPAWGVGPQMDRLVRFPSETAQTYLQAVQDDLRHIRAGDIHLSAYRIEGWRFLDRATLKGVIDQLHALGIRALVYFRAFVDDSDSGTDDSASYREATANGYVATTGAGTPYYFLSNFNRPAALIDFTNPAAVRWWDGRIAAALDAGADGFMEDFGEQTQVDMHFHDGETGATMHNRFPQLYHRATRQFLDRYERAHPHRSVYVYVRAGYNGSAAYEQSTFPGDETTDWTRASGLPSLASDMLNRAVGGAYGYDSDIGGYFDIGPYPSTTKDLLLRWAEWAALSPTFRLHGSISAGTHAPWTFDADTVRAYNRITALHERAEPLILRLWQEADGSGIPPTRPLWLAYPGDSDAARQDQEWLLGPDVLVAPVVEQGATSRDVYFPRGCWESPTTGQRVAGPRHGATEAPLDTLPYFFRCGTDPLARPSGPPLLGGVHGCVDRRRFSFHIHQPPGTRIVRALAYVDGRLVRRVRGGRVARIALRRLPPGRFTLRIVAVAADGRRDVSVRRYRGCHKGRPRNFVRPPRRGSR